MSAPFVPLNTGDVNDDDPQVLDSLFIETDAPPIPVVQPVPAAQPVPQDTPNRLLTGTQLIDPAWTTPTQLLPADLNRKHLILTVISPSASATDYVKITGDPNADAGPTFSAAPPMCLDDYTGPLYARATGAAVVRVTWQAVTK